MSSAADKSTQRCPCLCPSQSIKCTDCGKVLRNADFASFHAEKSGHTNFEESTEEVRERMESSDMVGIY